jgi:aspartate racemase
MDKKKEIKERVVGILGGMGPEATVDFFSKLTSNTPAKSDQQHLHVIIYSNPKVPDRTEAILNNGQSPLPFLVEGCKSLERAGADFIVIPCVTAHYFLNELRKETRLPILSILDTVAEDISEYRPKIRNVGLIGTSGTVKSGIFQKRMSMDGQKCIVCSERDQEKIMQAIYGIKAGVNKEKIQGELSFIAKKLIDSGAEGILAGCTEIPLCLTQEDVTTPYFDPLLILARHTSIRARSGE